MGNSNSATQFTPNDVDLRHRAHWQYLSQQHQQQQQRGSFQQNGASQGTTSTTSIKVLPELNDSNGHLRPTDNGVILFNGGTISARGRDSVGVVRSKSISSPQHEAQRYMRGLQRHNTQLDMPGMRASTNGLGLRRDVDPKLFGSEPDLRQSPGETQTGGRNPRRFKGQSGHPQNQQQQQQQQQQREYDSTRFGWRPKSHQPASGQQQHQQQPHHQQHQMSNHHQHSDRMPPIEPKKPRLFKTREETKKVVVSSKANQSKLATEASDVQSKKPMSGRPVHAKRDSERSRDDSTTDRVIKVIGNRAPVPEKLLPKAEVLSKPVYRREKSFDISLLLSRGAQKGTSLFPNVFRKSSATTDKHPPVTHPDKHAPPSTTSTLAGDQTNKSRRASQPPRANDKDFQKELQEATRRRSMLVPVKEDKSVANKSPSSVVGSGQKSVVTQSPVLKAIAKPRENARPQLKSKAPKPPPQQSPKVEANKIQLEIRNKPTAAAQQQSSRIEQSPIVGGRAVAVAAAAAVADEVSGATEKPVKSFYYGMPEQQGRTNNNANGGGGGGGQMMQMKVNGGGGGGIFISQTSSGSNSPATGRRITEDANANEEERRGSQMAAVVVEEKVELTAIESFAESIFAMKKSQQQQQQQNHQKQQHHRDSSESAVSSFVEDPVSPSLLYPGQSQSHLNNNHNTMTNSSNNTGCDAEFDEATLEGISLQLRPTLPKKQFEIPRFSPAAAWRLLSTAETREVNQLNCLDQKQQLQRYSIEGMMKDDEEEEEDDVDEERSERNQDNSSRNGVGEERQIERIYREPGERLADNKSGDSGISGDGGLEMGDSSPTNNLLVNDLRKLGPFLQPWTPQQDLEDDSSSDPDLHSHENHNGGLANGGDDDLENRNNINTNSLKSHRTIEDVVAQKHVFSLSLPRDNGTNNNNNHNNVSDKGTTVASDKHFFSSLQKTIGRGSVNGGGSQQAATSVSGNDNWFLGRSQPNSIEKNPMPSLSDNEEAISLPKITAQQQPAIQPPSFNYLAGGCHFMYLPNRPTTMSVVTTNSHNLSINGGGGGGSASLLSNGRDVMSEEKVNNGPATRSLTSSPAPPPPLPPPNNHAAPPATRRESSSSLMMRENLQDDDSPATTTTTTVWNLPYRLGGGRKGHRFTFQSTVRQIERRKLADKLSREAEEREAQRLSELEAMQKVEQEFQKKRAREKASIRQQLRLFSMETQQHQMDINSGFNGGGAGKSGEMIGNQFGDAEYSPSSIRREPDGAAEASLSKMNGTSCNQLSSTSLLLELNGYHRHSHRQQVPEYHQQQQYQSMVPNGGGGGGGGETNILSRDYSKFPYREFLK